MALKPDRHEFQQDISFFCNSVTERGVVLVFSTGGSGVALDDTAAVVTLPGANASGNKPAGLLLNDVVNNDLTRVHPNYWKNQMQVGGKVTLLKKGWVVTNMILPGVTPVVGDTAYVAASGRLTNSPALGGVACGKFLSAKDQTGYAKVEVNCP
jgi:hypothetical protein